MVISQKLTAVFPLRIAGVTFSSYAAVNALLLNLLIAVALTVLLNAFSGSERRDETSPSDYDDSEPQIELSSKGLVMKRSAPQVSR
jgi:hypothetical protein